MILMVYYTEPFLFPNLCRDGFGRGEKNTEDIRGCEHPEVLLWLPITSFSEDCGGDLECHHHQVPDAHEIWLLPKPR